MYELRSKCTICFNTFQWQRMTEGLLTEYKREKKDKEESQIRTGGSDGFAVDLTMQERVITLNGSCEGVSFDRDRQVELERQFRGSFGPCPLCFSVEKFSSWINHDYVRHFSHPRHQGCGRLFI